MKIDKFLEDYFRNKDVEKEKELLKFFYKNFKFETNDDVSELFLKDKSDVSFFALFAKYLKNNMDLKDKFFELMNNLNISENAYSQYYFKVYNPVEHGTSETILMDEVLFHFVKENKSQNCDELLVKYFVTAFLINHKKKELKKPMYSSGYFYNKISQEIQEYENYSIQFLKEITSYL